jgi:hypothetical protein
MAFEQLVAEAAAKKDSKKKNKDKKSSPAETSGASSSHTHPSNVAADAPNVPRAK